MYLTKAHAMWAMCVPLCVLASWRAPDAEATTPMGKVTKDPHGTGLLLGGKPFRFVSVNAMSTMLIADPLVTLAPPKFNYQFQPFDEARLPTAFEIEDIFLSVKQMGGTVIRVFAFSVQLPGHPVVNSSETSYWKLKDPQNPSDGFEWNPVAGAKFDYIIKMAHKYGIYIIPAFINEWTQTGGVDAFCKAYGIDCCEQCQSRKAFFSDPVITKPFFKLASELVEKYKGEPAILGWETGNEIGKNLDFAITTEFDTWTVDLAAAVKAEDPSALIVDGAMTTWAFPRPALRSDDGVDIVDVHFYPTRVQEPNTFQKWLPMFAQKCQGANKALMVGEVICHTDDCLKPLVDAVVQEPVASGLLVWALTGHRDSSAWAQLGIKNNASGGFFYHKETPPCALYGEQYYDYHWPGFKINDFDNESSVMAILQYGAAKIAGDANATVGPYPVNLPQPPAPIPTKLQKLLYQPGKWVLYFSGSAGAEWYEVFHGPSATGPWTPLNEKVMEIGSIKGVAFGFPPTQLTVNASQPQVCVTMVARNREQKSKVSESLCAAQLLV